MNGGWVADLGWTLLHFLWQGTAVAVIYAALRALLRRSLHAQGRYLLACLALTAMVAAPAITWFALPRGASRPLVSSFIPWTLPAETWQRLLPVFVAMWIAGVVVFSIRLLGGWRLVAHLRRASHPAEPAWQQVLDEIAAKVKTSRPVRLLVSPLLDVPTVIGWLRPVILVPLGTLTGLPAEHLNALLAHELAHIRRHDYLAGILQNIAETVLFYHPAVWWVSGEMREERELCCDDVAVATSGDVLVYARALAQLESIQSPRLEPALAANGGSLFHRIRRLIAPDEFATGHLPGPGTAWAMTLLWLAGVGVAALHAAQSPGPLKHIVTRAARALAAVTAQAAPAVVPPAVEMARNSLLFDPFLPAEAEPAGKREASHRNWSAAAMPVPAPAEKKTIALPQTDDRALPTLAWPAPLPGTAMKDLGMATVARLSTIQAGRNEPAAVQDPPDGIIRATTHLVEVEVVVRNSKGPVTGLSASDFRLYDNGQERAIGTFSAAASKKVTHAGTVIFFDRVGASALTDMVARHRVEEALRELPATERVAICALDNEFRVISEATDSPAKRAQALNELLPSSEAPVLYDISAKLNVLEAIAAQLAKVPGRKNLLWIGTDFSVTTAAENSMLHAHMVRVLHSLNVANIALFPIAIEGVAGSKAYGSSTSGSPQPFSFPLAGARAGFDLRYWAEQTDGYAAFNVDLRTALERVFNDEKASYTLGFYPETPDGTYHELRVKTGVKNTEVRSRQGYLAIAPPERPALFSNSGGQRSGIRLALNIVPSGIVFRKDGAGLHGQIRIAAIAKTPDGRDAAQFADTVDIHLKNQSEAEAFARMPWHYENPMAIAPGSYVIQMDVAVAPSSILRKTSAVSIEAPQAGN